VNIEAALLRASKHIIMRCQEVLHGSVAAAVATIPRAQQEALLHIHLQLLGDDERLLRRVRQDLGKHGQELVLAHQPVHVMLASKAMVLLLLLLLQHVGEADAIGLGPYRWDIHTWVLQAVEAGRRPFHRLLLLLLVVLLLLVLLLLVLLLLVLLLLLGVLQEVAAATQHIILGLPARGGPACPAVVEARRWAALPSAPTT